MLSEWGKWQPTVWEALAQEHNMPPEIVAILKNNMADLVAIEQKIGFANILALWPHFDNILKTYDAAKAAEKK
jgi:hypothetical protein